MKQQNYEAALIWGCLILGLILLTLTRAHAQPQYPREVERERLIRTCPKDAVCEGVGVIVNRTDRVVYGDVDSKGLLRLTRDPKALLVPPFSTLEMGEQIK